MIVRPVEVLFLWTDCPIMAAPWWGSAKKGRADPTYQSRSIKWKGQPVPYIPSSRSTPPGGRQRFSEADKKRIVEETCREGASVSGLARQYGITARLLFRWKQDLAPVAQTETTLPPVTLMDIPDRSAEASQSVPGPAPVIVERAAPGIEVELIGASHHRPSCGGHLGGLLINRSEMILISDKPPWKKQL